jgi:hypothetical protein
MSKRTAKKDKRAKEKQSRKAAQRALYESYKDQGITKNSKRFKRNSKKQKSIVSTKSHPTGSCGNVGCLKCNGVNFNQFLDKNKKPVGMPNWMFKQWLNQKQKAG